MPDLSEVWGVAKPILEFGVVGALLLLMIKSWKSGNKDLINCIEEKVTMEKEHGVAMIEMQREHIQQMTGLVRQQDATLNEVENTLQKLVEVQNALQEEDDEE